MPRDQMATVNSGCEDIPSISAMCLQLGRGSDHLQLVSAYVTDPRRLATELSATPWNRRGGPMNSRTLTRMAVAVVSITIAAYVTEQRNDVRAQRRPDLTGTWKLN